MFLWQSKGLLKHFGDIFVIIFVTNTRKSRNEVFVLHGDKKSKYARLCGPKTNQTWPFDALRKLGPLGSNSLEMWDVPFDTNSNKIYIAFDSDQSYHFKGKDPLTRTANFRWKTVHGSLSKGFKLNYWFESIIHELGGFRQALFYLRDQLLADVRLVTSQMQKFLKFSSSNFKKFQREYRHQTDR